MSTSIQTSVSGSIQQSPVLSNIPLVTLITINTHPFPVFVRLRLSASVRHKYWWFYHHFLDIAVTQAHEMYIYAVYYLHCWTQCLCTYLKLRILLEDKCLFLVQLLEWALCFDCTDISLSTSEWGRLTEGHLELECPRRDAAGCLTYQLSSPEGKKMKPFNGWIFLLSKVMTCLLLVSWNEWKKKREVKTSYGESKRFMGSSSLLYYSPLTL